MEGRCPGGSPGSGRPHRILKGPRAPGKGSRWGCNQVSHHLYSSEAKTVARNFLYMNFFYLIDLVLFSFYHQAGLIIIK